MFHKAKDSRWVWLKRPRAPRAFRGKVKEFVVSSKQQGDNAGL